MDAFVHLYNVCWTSRTQISFLFAVVLSVTVQECAHYLKEIVPGEVYVMLSILVFSFSKVFICVVCQQRCTGGTWLRRTIINDTKQTLLGNINKAFLCRATNHSYLIVAPKCDLHSGVTQKVFIYYFWNLNWTWANRLPLEKKVDVILMSFCLKNVSVFFCVAI